METTIIESIVTDKESRQYSPGHLTPAATDSDATTKALMLSGDQETCSTDEEIKIQCQYCGQFEVNGEWDGIKREDDIIQLGGEVGFHPLTHLMFKLNYRYEERDTNLKDDLYDYTDNRILFSVNFGF